MTPKEYIEQQCQSFEKCLNDNGVAQKFQYDERGVAELDQLRQLIWKDGTADLENAVAISWGAAFTKIISNVYVSQWQVDPEANLPVVVLKCGGKGMQVKSIVYAAKAFKSGERFVDVWSDLQRTLAQAGAELA